MKVDEFVEYRLELNLRLVLPMVEVEGVHVYARETKVDWERRVQGGGLRPMKLN